jgi:hypothetical protein
MTRRRAAAWALMSSVPCALASLPVHAADPPLAPGRDPGGTAVAIIARGFDVTFPEFARVLARDGEGEAIAWDAIDEDRRPFAPDHDGTGLALAVAAKGSVRVVPIRADVNSQTSLARAVAFAAATPARVVLVPLDAAARASLAVLIAASERFAGVLMLASLPAPTADEIAAAGAAPNLVLIDTAGRPLAAANDLARAFGCDQDGLGDRPELKQAFLDRLERPAPGCEPEASGPE